MFDGTYGEENYVCELGGVRHDELSLGRPVPEELRLILLGQKLDHPTLPLSAPPVDDLSHLTTENPKTRISLPPGHRLTRALRFLLPLKWYRSRIEPMVADMHEEYFEALRAGDLRHAQWIEARAYIYTLQTLLKELVDSIGRLLRLGK